MSPDPAGAGKAYIEGAEVGPGSLGWRLASLEALLDRACVAYSGVRAAGRESEIAVIEAPVTEVTALATLAREIRLLGFRYTTVDLAHVPDPAATAPAGALKAAETAPSDAET
jgi:hypothetical protein